VNSGKKLQKKHMKKIVLLSFIALISACGVKNTRKMLATGDFDAAIERSVKGLQSNKNSKGNQEYVYLLEEAFAKAKDRDYTQINYWIKEKSDANLEKIYNGYLNLTKRQDKIKPLLPLRLLKENRDAQFPFEDYSNEIVTVKKQLSDYLYANAQSLMSNRNKMDYRKAFDDFDYLNRMNPGYKNVTSLMNECKFKGTDFVFVNCKNETQMVIPTRLQDDLLNIGTYDLNDKWTVYQNKKEKNITYDYTMSINFRSILISPEKVLERQFVKERQVAIAERAKLDKNGNTIKDERGRPIMEDVMGKVTVTIMESRQNKEAKVDAMVEFRDARNELVNDPLPLSSSFVFEYIYSNFNGDRRACDQDYLQYFGRRAVPFPSNEQMVFDCGEDLKRKLKSIITGNRLRR
jgi:hypothetical protein